MPTSDIYKLSSKISQNSLSIFSDLINGKKLVDHNARVLSKTFECIR